jgi:hypothetical protein
VLTSLPAFHLSSFVDSIASVTYKRFMRLVVLFLSLVVLNGAAPGVLAQQRHLHSSAGVGRILLKVRRFLARNASVKPEEIKFPIDLARADSNVSRAEQECREAYFKFPRVRHKLKYLNC